MAKMMKKMTPKTGRVVSPEKAEQEAMAAKVMAMMGEQDMADTEARPMQRDRQGMKEQLNIQKQGLQNPSYAEDGEYENGEYDGSDSGMASKMWDIVDAEDPSVFSGYDGQTALVEKLGLQVTPKLTQFWDSLPPAERLGILEAIDESAGMASEEYIMESLARSPMNGKDQQQMDDVQNDVLKRVGVE